VEDSSEEFGVRAVQPTGPLSAKVAFIGEAPGEFEQAEGIPFHPKAPAGRELDRWLAVAGFRRDEVYIDNVIPIRPPNNNVGCFYSTDQQGRLRKGPRWEEFCGYVSQLKERLEKCQANVMVPLGRTALYALCGTMGASPPSISKLRGSILSSTLLPNRKAIPTYHPSPRNQDPEQRFFAMQDMIRAKGDSEFKELRLPERELVTCWDEQQVYDWLDSVYNDWTEDSIVALDIETLNDEISHLSLTMEPGKAIVIPFWTPYHNVWNVRAEWRIWDSIAELIEKYGCLGHNIQFDAYYLWRKLGIRVNVAHDTMVGFHIAYPGVPKDLGTLTSLYTREPFYKDDGGDFKVQPENEAAFLRYSALDAAVLHDILPGVLRDLKAQGNLEVYYDTIKLVEPVLFMQGKGIRLDMDRRSRMAGYYRRLEEHILAYMGKLLGISLNPNSHPQCVAYFHGEKVYLSTFKAWPTDEEKSAHVHALCAKSPKHRPSTKDGKIKVDEKALDKLADKGDPVARLIVKARECGKLRATFLEYVVVDGRSRSELSVAGAVSGRFSGRSFLWGEGTNHQNTPHAIKACMVAD